MPTTTPETTREIEAFRHQAEMIDEVLRINARGLTHEDSLIQPRPAGNCLNWVVGHLLWTYDYNLPELGQEPVMEEGALKWYARGVPPLRDRSEALDFQGLLNAWDESAGRIDAGLEGLTADALKQPARPIAGDDSGETVRERLIGVLFHQAYHIGQTALLRRIAGKDGAIA